MLPLTKNSTVKFTDLLVNKEGTYLTVVIDDNNLPVISYSTSLDDLMNVIKSFYKTHCVKIDSDTESFENYCVADYLFYYHSTEEGKLSLFVFTLSGEEHKQIIEFLKK